MDYTQLAADKAEHERELRVRRYVGEPKWNVPGNLMLFCREVLGYTALSDEFHGPMLAEWDRMDLRRFRLVGGMKVESGPLDSLDLWARGHIKTWCMRARVLRYYVWNPGCTVTWWHAVEEKALESGAAIAQHLRENKVLRGLFRPGVLPAANAVKFYTGGKFNLKGRRIGDGPSFVAMGAGGEATGGHSMVAVLDDFVGWNDVVDSQMPKKKDFYRGTVRNVVLRITEETGAVK